MKFILLLLLVVVALVFYFSNKIKKKNASRTVNFSKPKQIVSVNEANSYVDAQERNDFWNSKYRWKLDVSVGQLSFIERIICSLKILFLKSFQVVGLDWIAKSPFGSVRQAVVLKNDGKLDFDRPVYDEAKNVNICVWGIDFDGNVRVGVIDQFRPHSSNPMDDDSNTAVKFGQIPMGFNLNKLFGDDVVDKYEDAMSRELKEEMGDNVILNIEETFYPWLNASPSFLETWNRLFFVQVNIEKIKNGDFDINEGIVNAEFLTIKELDKRIATGLHGDVVFRYGNALALWKIYQTLHPEFYVAEYLKGHLPDNQIDKLKQKISEDWKQYTK